MANAVNLAMADNGPMTSWTFGADASGIDAETFANTYLIPYLNISKNCGIDTSGDCAVQRKNLNQTTYTDMDSSYVRFFLNDGTLLYGSLQNDSDRIRFLVCIDINGVKSPNTLGRDVFVFNYYKSYPSHSDLDGKFGPEGIQYDRDSIKTSTWGCDSTKTGSYCAAMMIQDSWRILDDYPW